MIDKIDGLCFKNMVDYGIRNLNKHCKTLNRLNVFPVPDGDTGTNMLTTVSRGLGAVGESLSDLSSVSRKFAKSIVFEARGNSGVIVSQFFKGFSETFFDVEHADAALLIRALEKGVESAHSAVSNPVEGTMLTVLKDATEAVGREYDAETGIDDVMSLFLDNARASLDNTPELLPALKEAGVVDSGGAGIVYLFEGMKKYLDGDDIEQSFARSEAKSVDYSLFDKNSSFDLGYCTELLIQLIDGKTPFVYEEFKTLLNGLGNSVVIACDDSKVRVHIHTDKPEQILKACHVYGEFLSLKIENMSVQHTETQKRILTSKNKNDGAFSVVAVAPDSALQKLFVNMGADVAIYCKDGVCTKDYIDAFEKLETEHIIVFPNSSDAIHSAISAKNIYEKATVTVISSRSPAECYAALPTIDFGETDTDAVADLINETVNNMYIISVACRDNEFYAFSGKEIVSVSDSLSETVLSAIGKTMQNGCYDVITVFKGENAETADVEEKIAKFLTDGGFFAEVFSVVTDDTSGKMTLSFE